MLVNLLRLSSLVEADKDGVALVASACIKLAECPTTIDTLWPGKQYGLATLLTASQQLTEARIGHERLKSAARALRKLQHSLDAKLDVMERSLIPALHHHGFHDLPNEVLTKILEDCFHKPCEENNFSLDSAALDDNEKLRRLALVNHRLRDCVYKTSSLWSDIFYSTKPRMNRSAAVLDIAKASRLHISYTNDVQLVPVDHINRWETLRLETLDLLLRRKASPARLPALRSLVMDLQFGYVLAGSDELALSHALDPFYLPTVRSLRLTVDESSAPLSIVPPCTLVSQLTSLSLTRHRIASARDIGFLLVAISSGRQLRDLEIGCSCISYTSDVAEFDNAAGSVEMSLLESFKFGFVFETNRPRSYDGNGGWGADTEILKQACTQAILSLPRAFIMERLSTLAIEARDTFRLEDMLSPHCDYAYLRHISLKLPFETWRINSSGLFRQFTHVDSVSLCIWDKPCTTVSEWGEWGVVSPAPAHEELPPITNWDTQTSLHRAQEDTSGVELPGAAELAKLRELVLDGRGSKRDMARDLRTILQHEVVSLQCVNIWQAAEERKTGSGDYREYCPSRMLEPGSDVFIHFN